MELENSGYDGRGPKTQSHVTRISNLIQKQNFLSNYTTKNERLGTWIQDNTELSLDEVLDNIHNQHYPINSQGTCLQIQID